MESYARALPRKRMEIAAAWRRWRDAPADALALQAMRLPVHRLAGSALTHGFAEIGSQASRIDQAMLAWIGEPEDVRDPPEALLAQLAARVDALLEEMADARAAVPGLERRHPALHAALSGTQLPAVLLVEDDPEQALEWRERLSDAGFEVRAIESVEALEPELALDPPDVLLVDYWLADRTAADLERELVRRDCYARIPRVCLTGDIGDAPRHYGRAAGFVAVVHKSTDIAELAAILRHAIAEARRR